MLAARIDPPESRRSSEARRTLNRIEHQNKHIKDLKNLIKEYKQEYDASFSEDTLYTGYAQDCLSALIEQLEREHDRLVDCLNSDIDSLSEFGYVM